MFKKPWQKNKSKKKNQGQPPEGPIRVKLPQGEEVLGVVEQRVGGNRMIIKCLDGVSRNCRVPGRLRRRLWVREGDIVIIQPWEFDKEKGDILFKYNPTQVEWLKKRGYLDNVPEL